MEPTPKRTRLGGLFENTRFGRFEDDDETTSLAHLVLTRARPALPSLHLAPMIYEFLDCSKQWTFEAATEAGFTRLLRLLAMRVPLGLPNGFDKLRFVTNIEIAARTGDVTVLEWWHTFYLPYRDMQVEQEVARIAAYIGHLNVIKWAHDRQNNGTRSFHHWNGHNPRSLQNWNDTLYVSSPEIVRWMHENSRSARLIVLLHEVAAQGDLKFIKWIRHKTSYSCEIRDNAIFAAVQAGHLDIVQYFYVLEPSIQLSVVFKLAAEAGYLHIVQWLLSEDEDAEEHLLLTNEMIENPKSHAIIEWLAEKYTWKHQNNKETWLVNSMEQVASSGSIKLLQYLYEHYHSDQPLTILDAAVSGGNVEMAKWLYDHGVGSDVDDLLLESVDSSELEMVQWVHENYPDLETTTNAMDMAAHDSLDIVKFLHENRAEGCTSEAMDNAAQGCNLALVKFMHENRSEGCTQHAMDYAAANGSLGIVEFLHENRSEGCTTDAMDIAAAHGHMNILKFLHDHRPEGCTANAMTTAADRGHLDIVKFLIENRSVGVAEDAMNQAASNGHFQVVQLLHQSHPEENIAKALANAAVSGCMNIVQLLRCRADKKQISDAMYQAADKGNRDIVAYLAQYCQPDFGKSEIKRAVRRGHLSLLEWILEKNKSQDSIFYEFDLDRIFDRQIGKWRKRVQRYGCVSYGEHGEEGNTDSDDDEYF